MARLPAELDASTLLAVARSDHDFPAVDGERPGDPRADASAAAGDERLHRVHPRAAATGFGRRAIIEQAKGILMERHQIDAQTAFGRLRRHSQQTGQPLIDLAQAITSSHQLLHSPTPAEDDAEADPGGAHSSTALAEAA